MSLHRLRRGDLHPTRRRSQITHVFKRDTTLVMSFRRGCRVAAEIARHPGVGADAVRLRHAHAAEAEAGNGQVTELGFTHAPNLPLRLSACYDASDRYGDQRRVQLDPRDAERREQIVERVLGDAQEVLGASGGSQPVQGAEGDADTRSVR